MIRHSTASPPAGGAAVAVPAVQAVVPAREWTGSAKIAVAGLARVVILTMLALLVWAAAPAAVGWSVTTVMTGSMEPRIHPGDVVVARPVAATELAIGQILLVDDPDHQGRLRLHRFVGTGPGGMVLRGDANQSDDSSAVGASAVHGVGFLRVPYVGLPVLWVAEGRWTSLLLMVLAVASLVALSLLDRGLVAPRKQARTALRTRRHRRRPSTIPALSVALVAVLAAGALAGLLVVRSGSHAAFSKASPNARSTLSAANPFDCFTQQAPDSPSFLYRFSEASGSTTADASGNGATGTLVNAPTRVSGSCPPGSSPALNLSQGFVSTPSALTAPTTMTMEIWLKSSTTAGGRLMGFGSSQAGTSSSPDRLLYLTDSGKVVAGVYSNGILGLLLAGPQTVASTASYNDGQWHHVVATLSGSTLRLYVDGAAVGTTAVSAVRSGTGYWRIGADAIPSAWSGAPTSVSLAGSVDDAAAYPVALSAAQVSAHYAAGR